MGTTSVNGIFQQTVEVIAKGWKMKELVSPLNSPHNRCLLGSAVLVVSVYIYTYVYVYVYVYVCVCVYINQFKCK